MKSEKFRFFLLFVILTGFLLPLQAEDRRTIPLDLYLIIDGSSSLKDSKNDTIAWINNQVIDRILINGDKVTIWTAGDKAQVIYSDTITSPDAIKVVKDKLTGIDTGAAKADFTTALKEAGSKISQTQGNRLAFAMVIAASAEGLEPTIATNSQGLLRWFRSEKYERWQVLIVAPDIGKKVQQAGAAYMSSLR